MELSQLRTVIHAAELGSLSKAADRLRIAQPALSRQIRMLEEELGVRLFDRHGRGMLLTDQGQDVLSHALRVMAELEDIRTIVRMKTRRCAGMSPSVCLRLFQTSCPNRLWRRFAKCIRLRRCTLSAPIPAF